MTHKRADLFCWS